MSNDHQIYGQCPGCGEIEIDVASNTWICWSCGTMRYSDGKISRGDSCYEAELAALKALVRELINLPKILNNDDSDKFNEILNRPEVKDLLKES